MRDRFFDSENREVFDVEIYVDRRSSVDSFIEKAFYDDGSPVSDGELEYLQDEYGDYVQEYAYSNGSANHN
jgi:hypothetical protein